MQQQQQRGPPSPVWAPCGRSYVPVAKAACICVPRAALQDPCRPALRRLVKLNPGAAGSSRHRSVLATPSTRHRVQGGTSTSQRRLAEGKEACRWLPARRWRAWLAVPRCSGRPACRSAPTPGRRRLRIGGTWGHEHRATAWRHRLTCCRCACASCNAALRPALPSSPPPQTWPAGTQGCRGAACGCRRAALHGRRRCGRPQPPCARRRPPLQLGHAGPPATRRARARCRALPLG